MTINADLIVGFHLGLAAGAIAGTFVSLIAIGVLNKFDEWFGCNCERD